MEVVNNAESLQNRKHNYLPIRNFEFLGSHIHVHSTVDYSRPNFTIVVYMSSLRAKKTQVDLCVT